MESFTVKLYVYDLSRGLARSLSPMLLGRQIDGVWHTGVVVYDQEFYFGGMGIESCTPGCTMLGQPTSIVELGSTELPFDIFMEHLSELARSTFRPECYHLLNHNCNTFSDEIAQFLTGERIPSHITSLPMEVLQTPFGAMIKPLIDSMTMNPNGGHRLFSDGTDGRIALVTSEPQNVSGSTSELPPVVTYPERSMLKRFSELRGSSADHLSREELRYLDEVYEYVTSTAVNDWSLRPLHLQTICQSIANNVLSIELRVALSSVLRVALLSEDIVTVCNHDPNESLVVLLRQIDVIDTSLAEPLAKCACNFAAAKAAAPKFLDDANHKEPLVVGFARFLMLDNDAGLQLIGSQITSNLLRNLTLHRIVFLLHGATGSRIMISAQSLSEDLALDLGITLVESCRNTDHQSAEHKWFSLCMCIQSNSEVAALVTATDLDISEHEQKFSVIIKYTSAARRFFS